LISSTTKTTKKKTFKIPGIKLGTVVPAYNPRHSGGRNRRIMVQGWPGQKVHETPTSTNKKLGVMAHAYHPS
jgi:hypothetical protein